VPALVLTKEQLSFDRMPGVDVSVLVVDMESRHMPQTEAYELVHEITSDAVKHGVRYFYKKTDSALRGNIGAELAGLLDASSDSCLSFIPAFPKSGRITKNGVQYIDGIEVANSVFGKDPFDPVTRSSIADIIRLQTDIPTENITRDIYSRAADKPPYKVLRILDAENMDDIEKLGAHLKRGNNFRLTAGCAGFAEILPELLELSSFEMSWKKNADNILIISGSVNPIAIGQLSRGQELGFSVFTLSPSQKLNALYPGSRECETFVRDIAEKLDTKGRVIVQTVGSLNEISEVERLACDMAIRKNEVSRRVAWNIGELTLQILNNVHVGNLVVFGGDTLHSILTKMRCEGVLPVFEIAPGLVVAHVLSPDHGCVMITKSGGLGGNDVLDAIDSFVYGDSYEHTVAPR
jgi:uncharacterized protein YgbK (DUF1537 family)